MSGSVRQIDPHCKVADHLTFRIKLTYEPDIELRSPNYRRVKGKFPMPTQEERLTALERSFTAFQKEAAAHIRETEENTTILLGVIRSQGQDIKRIVQHLETIDERLG